MHKSVDLEPLREVPVVVDHWEVWVLLHEFSVWHWSRRVIQHICLNFHEVLDVLIAVGMSPLRDVSLHFAPQSWKHALPALHAILQLL